MGRAALSVVAIGIAGCAATASVTSAKRQDWDRMLERTLIRFDPAAPGFDFVDARTRLEAELQVRGVASRYAAVAGPFTLDAPPNLLDQAKAFQATTILALDHVGGTVAQHEVKYVILEGKIWDVATAKLVWRAKIGYTPGNAGAEVLVREVVTTLVKDGLVQGPPPAPPKAR